MAGSELQAGSCEYQGARAEGWRPARGVRVRECDGPVCNQIIKTEGPRGPWRAWEPADGARGVIGSRSYCPIVKLGPSPSPAVSCWRPSNDD
jgi:hypothetical protein